MTKVNIEGLEKQDRIEKTVVIILLFAAIASAIWAFTRTKDNSQVIQNNASNENTSLTDNNLGENGDLNVGENMALDTEDASSDETAFQEEASAGAPEKTEDGSAHIETQSEATEVKMGILAVGLFANPENAERMKIKLNELGFQGVSRVRSDGKIIVGVKTHAEDAALHVSVAKHFNDAIFVIPE